MTLRKEDIQKLNELMEAQKATGGMEPLKPVRDPVWQELLENLKNRKNVDLQRLKTLVRAGIPASERAEAWVVLSKSA